MSGSTITVCDNPRYDVGDIIRVEKDYYKITLIETTNTITLKRFNWFWNTWYRIKYSIIKWWSKHIVEGKK